MNREVIARSLGTWRERLTWRRRLRGERSALQELHCEHKAKAEGEGRDQAAAPTRFPRVPPTSPLKSSHTHSILDSVFSLRVSHHEVYLQVSRPLFYAFSPGQCISSILEGHVCVWCACVYVYVYMWRRGLGRVNNSTFSKTEGGKEETEQ